MMTTDPITIEPTATVREAAKLIARRKHNRLPVVEHGRLVGVVTRVDVLDALISNDEE
jgi:CBS domain-containing protein